MSNVDIQCKKILNGLNLLDNYLDEPLARDALELDSNSSTVKNKELLKRLRLSLIQYTERGKDLVYIGFMGHFSTGKSSTINSLLVLNQDSSQYRKIGLNPVDKNITLITSRSNQDSIINVTKEGLVPIRSTFIESSFLDNIVIVDTPGTGDPILIGDIAKDFLPICDLIIYFFSATNPLDSADKPLLEEKFSELFFIPTKFAITRSDEFIKNSKSEFSEDNFDSTKANTFLEEFTQRINQLFQNRRINISSDDIFLIDNKASFKIEELRQFILEFSNPDSLTDQILMHSHKIDYFQSSASELQSFFSDFIDKKICELSRFVDIANQNIERFNNAIHISNNNLTHFWTNSSIKIKTEAEDFSSSLPNINPSPRDILSYEYRERTEKRDNLKKEISEKSRELVNDILNYSRQEGAKVFEQQLSELRDNINKAKINTIKDSEKFSPNTNIEASYSFSNEGSEFYCPDLLENSSSRFILDIEHKFKEDYENLFKGIVELESSLSSQSPFPIYAEILDDADQRLDKDFERFFEIVTLYLSGVLSYTGKETIQNLGLGEKLDRLESKNNLSELKKEGIKKDARERIFPDKTNIVSSFIQEISDLNIENQKLKKDFEKFRREVPPTQRNVGFVWNEEDFEPINDEISRNINRKINKLRQEISRGMNSIIFDVLNLWEEDFVQLKRKRILYFRNAIIISIIIWLILYYLYMNQNGIKISNDLQTSILIGVLGNSAYTGISVLITRAFDRFPKKIKLTEIKVLETFREHSFKLIKDEEALYYSSKDYQSSETSTNKNSDIVKVSEYISQCWEKVLIDQPLNSIPEYLGSYYNDFKDLKNRYYKITNNYLELVNSFAENISAYFSDTDDNLNKLRELSDTLKQNAVDPSFDLLASTRDTLKEVKRKIDEISFIKMN